VDTNQIQIQPPTVRDLTRGSIFRQLISLAFPLMAIGFIQMAYNLVNILWIGRLGSESVAAIGSVGMLMWMMNSMGLVSKVGAEISIGQSIGASRLDRASVYASHTTMIALLLGLLFGAYFFLLPTPIRLLLPVGECHCRRCRDYLRIISLGIPLMFLVLNFSGIYIGSGRSSLPFYFNATGLALNILLDPLFIFGLGVVPAMGIRGAALATVLSQAVVLLLFVRHLRGPNGALGGGSIHYPPPQALHARGSQTGSTSGRDERLLRVHQHALGPNRIALRRALA